MFLLVVVPQPSGDSGPCVGPVLLDPQFVGILARLQMSLWWSSCHSSSAHPLPKLMSILVCILSLCVIRKLFFQGLVNGQRFPVTVTRVTCVGRTHPATRSPSLLAALVWLWRGSLCKDPASQGSCLCWGPVTDTASGGGPALPPPASPHARLFLIPGLWLPPPLLLLTNQKG